VSPSDLLNRVISDIDTADRTYLSIIAELMVRRLGELTPEAFAIIRSEAAACDKRWRWAVRRILAKGDSGASNVRRAVELLELVGTQEDAGILRGIAHLKGLGCPNAGRALLRRLASRVMVEDLGRLTIVVGERRIPGTSVRKKVLSILGFLLTRSQFTATREQVLEALWPEMEPTSAANSLNQTVYFLRREFEPEYQEDFTAGYLHTRGDLIWLDSELVSSRSSVCLRLIRAMGKDPDPAIVSELADNYCGRFAVDFIYDEWASGFRDTLHASFLDRMERAIKQDTENGVFERAIATAQKAILADPDAEQIEFLLLRLYRLSGANAAASEQYAHYAAVLREQLGLEPPPLESI
jgi:DNA-binding SARP family transcriptional activator